MSLFIADVGQGKVHVYDSGTNTFYPKLPEENLINLNIAGLKKGDTLVILEAMKMEHQVKAIEDGKVSQVLIKKDDQLENGALLMIVD